MSTQDRINTYWRQWFDAIKAQDLSKAVRCRRSIDVLSQAQTARRATRRALAGILVQ